MWSPAEVLRDWIRCPEKVTILMDSIRSLSGVHQDSLIVTQAATLRESRWTPAGLLIQFQVFTWICGSVS